MACGVWGVVGLLIASAGFGTVNDDARLLVLGATTVGVGAAFLAARLILRDHPRWAGLCLVVSIVIPTWYAAALNVVPLVAGLVLLSGRLTSWIRGPMGSNKSDPIEVGSLSV